MDSLVLDMALCIQAHSSLSYEVSVTKMAVPGAPTVAAYAL